MLQLRLLLVSVFISASCCGQDVLSDALKMNFTDVAETKRRAEAGDVAAQLSLTNTFASNFRPTDALVWYRKPLDKAVLKQSTEWEAFCFRALPVYLQKRP